jgi:7-cyano-7-deazaguanine synthase
MKKAVVLLSGGLDSSTTLYYAVKKGYKCRALIFDYGQRHKREVNSAIAIAERLKILYEVIRITLPWKGSALLNKKQALPANRPIKAMSKNIPPTYVPARNTIFLGFALSFAEATGADAIFIGANAVDFSGYPDCRPDYYRAFRKVVRRGTKTGKIKVITPLINMGKAQIIKLAYKLGVPVELTWSCYKGDKEPCGVCDSCKLRKKGMKELGIGEA